VCCRAGNARSASYAPARLSTVQFVLVGSLIILAWVFINGAVKYLESTGKALARGGEFDPEPWILLNLTEEVHEATCKGGTSPASR